MFFKLYCNQASVGPVPLNGYKKDVAGTLRSGIHSQSLTLDISSDVAIRTPILVDEMKSHQYCYTFHIIDEWMR